MENDRMIKKLKCLPFEFGRISIIFGENGSGKTTFLNKIRNRVETLKQKYVYYKSKGKYRDTISLFSDIATDYEQVFIVDDLDFGMSPLSLQIIKSYFESGFYARDKKFQVFATVNSPYFLDLMPFDGLIYVSRKWNGYCSSSGAPVYIEEPIIRKVKDIPNIKAWNDKFPASQLWSMGNFDHYLPR